MRKHTVQLLKKKIFLPLFLTQFWGALNDNAFKLSMLTLISYHISLSLNQSQHYQALAGALYILPFFLFSATAGQMADKYDKACMSIYIKMFEVLLMIIGGISLCLQNLFLMMITLAGMGIHSTFFGPIKYAILPDHLPAKELLGATSLVEASTFLAILLGTTLGTLSIGSAHPHTGYAIVLINLVAVAGLISSFFIPKAPPKAVNLKIDWHVWRATLKMVNDTMVHHKLLPVMLIISWFWFLGSIILIKLPDYIHFILKAETSVFAFFLALFSIGIACGAVTIGYLLAGHVTLRYVPLAMLLLSLFGVDLFLASSSSIGTDSLQSLTLFLSKWRNLRITVDFFLYSFCGGLFIVPLYTYLQITSHDAMRARTIATNNILNAFFMVLGSGLVVILLYFNVSIPAVFLTLSILNSLVALGLWLLLQIKSF